MGRGKYAPKYEWKDVIRNTWPYNLAHVIACEEISEISDEEANQMYNLSIPYLFNLLETATERERKIIILRFKEGLTLEQACNEFGLSGRKIAEIENRALGKLRRKCRMGLRIFIDIDQLNDWEQLEEKAIIWGIGYKGFKYENGILKGELWKRLGLFEWKTPVEDIIRAKKEEELNYNGLDEYELPLRTYNFLKKGASCKI